MYLVSKDRKPVVTARLAIRVAIMAGLALAFFSIIFFRLWFLQILSGDKYLAQSKTNQVREIKVEAPRGEVVDRNGAGLVNNRTALAVQLVPQKLPQNEAGRERLFRSLSRVLNMPVGRIKQEIRTQLKRLPFSAVTLKTDVPYSTVLYMQEHQADFPGTSAERVFLRHYPHKTVGAHLFGTVGEVSPGQLKQKKYDGVKQGDKVGQSGLENVYDRYIRGVNGASRVQVDAFGQPTGELTVRRPEPGKRLRLSIDMKTQKAAEAAINTGVAAFGRGSAAVAIDPRTGAVVALASYPTFDPNIFSRPISEVKYKQLTSNENGAPLSNRAIQGLYPTGSTFKLISAAAGLESGLITPDTVIFDGGSLKVGGVTFNNAGGASYGAISLNEALKVSSDVYFYTLGLRANHAGDNSIQKWARMLGLGHKTGIDLPSEAEGLIPTPKWRNRLFKKKQTDRPWSDGDSVNLAVGQGDLQADPLQMAVAYSAVANGGYVVVPRIAQRVEDATGQVIQEVDPPTRRKLPMKEGTRKAIMRGLYAAANEPGGTSEEVFSNFKVPVAGKTGTAERAGQGDQSWYVAMAPYPDPEIVVAVTVENGGFGAESAAPAVKQILSTYFGVNGKRRER